ncbi:MAG TPA: hypothetical protein VEX38_04595 [Fimbriimonadaceae bacterium]|nr:hypothetical protein [Fimbriimonadaceae bacterium]
MFKKLALAAVMAMAVGAAMPAVAQVNSKQMVAGSDVDTAWRQGLTTTQVNQVQRITRNKTDTHRWAIYLGIVRARDVRRDIFPSENLDMQRVVANARVRMSTEEAQMFLNTWNRLSQSEKTTLVAIMRSQLRPGS